MTATCPHCGANLAGSNRHCTNDQSRTCDWRVCRTCASLIAGPRHMHAAKTPGPCKQGLPR